MTLVAKMHFSKNVFGYFCMLRFSSKRDKNKEDLFCCFGGNRQRERRGEGARHGSLPLNWNKKTEKKEIQKEEKEKKGSTPHILTWFIPLK